MSGYQRINFKDQNVERPKTYDVTNNPDGSITLIESFGNVEELGTPINQENMNHLEDGIDAVSFSKFSLDLTYKKDDLVTDIQDDELKIFKSLKDNNFGHLPSENDYWEEVEIAGGGGGLEIGDIGIAPLGIDETKGKRRYLNGQIIVQDQYAVFSEKVKNAIALYPTLGCTEQEWQTTATMTVGGQVGKFVVDDEGGTIRLPKIIMPIQGLTDLSKLAEIVEAGLPNIDGQSTGMVYNSNPPTGAFTKTDTVGAIDGSSLVLRYVNFDASISSSIYGNSDTVQQEQIQYPYFIQVATGAETEDNIVNTLELNNPFVLLEPKFFEAEVYNVSWLLANGTYNGSNAVHPSAYQALLVENNTEVAIGSTVTLPIGTEYTKRGLSVKLSTDSDITDYDFVVNASDETFRLPIKVNLASDNDLYLYFYVGETVQNANLVNVGRIEEKLSDKVDITNTEWASNASAPDFENAIIVSLPYTTPCDGWLNVFFEANTNGWGGVNITLNGVAQGIIATANSSTKYASTFGFAPKGATLTQSGSNITVRFMPLKGIKL